MATDRIQPHIPVEWTFRFLGILRGSPLPGRSPGCCGNQRSATFCCQQAPADFGPRWGGGLRTGPLERGIAAPAQGRYGPDMSSRPSAIDEAERAGFDLSLIEESLSLSYDQRAIQHQQALNLALEVERAGRELRERPKSVDSAPLRR